MIQNPLDVLVGKPNDKTTNCIPYLMRVPFYLNGCISIHCLLICAVQLTKKRKSRKLYIAIIP
jgi:hypothetical protein